MRAARVDGNQSAIVDGLRAAGVSVFVTSNIGGGFPDLLCSRAGTEQNFLIEIKDPSKPKADRQLTPDQVKFRDSWQGQYAVVESLEQALAVIFAPASPQGQFEPVTGK